MKWRLPNLARASCWVLFNCWALFVIYLSSINGEQLSRYSLNIPHGDKALHLIEFAIGGIIFSRALFLTTKLTWKKVLPIAIIGISIFGITDEWHQTYIPHRSGGNIGDWFADTIGAAFGSLIVCLSYLRKRELKPNEKITELGLIIQLHNWRYYKEVRPTISDRQYDSLYSELIDLEKNHPELVSPDSPTQCRGSGSLKGLKQLLQAPILNTATAYSEEEVRRFFAGLQELLPGHEIEIVIEPRVNGIDISLLYLNGFLKYAAIHGDNREWDNITQDAQTINSIPNRLNTGCPSVLEVKGCLYLPQSEFQKLNFERTATGKPLFADPIEAAVNLLKQNAMNTLQLLKVVLCEVGLIKGVRIDAHSETLMLLQDCGLPRNECFRITRSVDAVLEAIRELGKKRHSFDYQTDGAVIKLNSFHQREIIGMTSRFPPWAMVCEYQ